MKLVLLYVLVCLDGCYGICPTGWLQYQDSCLLFDSKLETWYGASELCGLHHYAQLVKLETPEKAIFVKSYLQIVNYTGSVWIDGNDELKTDHWVWSGKETPITYFDWAPKEPNDLLGQERCIFMWDKYHHKWADAPCSLKWAFVCEKSADACSTP